MMGGMGQVGEGVIDSYQGVGGGQGVSIISYFAFFYFYLCFCLLVSHVLSFF